MNVQRYDVIYSCDVSLVYHDKARSYLRGNNLILLCLLGNSHLLLENRKGGILSHL